MCFHLKLYFEKHYARHFEREKFKIKINLGRSETFVENEVNKANLSILICLSIKNILIDHTHFLRFPDFLTQSGFHSA